MPQQVHIIDEQELPEGVGWAMVFKDDVAIFFVKPSALTEEELADAWRAFVKGSGLNATPGRHVRLVD